jgi:hypothetical protein
MKFLGKFLKTIFRLTAPKTLKLIQTKSLESVLINSVHLLDPAMVTEIRQFIIAKQTSEGGFADRGGKTDLYYSLFGFFVAESLDITEVKEPFKKFIKHIADQGNLTGVHLFCAAILYAKIFGIDAKSQNLKRQILLMLSKSTADHQEYISFLAILALYYLEDYPAVWKMINKYKAIGFEKEVPCPVMAAKVIMMEISGRHQPESIDQLLSFYRNRGGFVALKKTSTEDLLSTAVALYAMHFQEADLRLIKPDCLAFVDGLYEGGGFLATKFDILPDTEYTFYGLLALGSLC